VAIVYLVVVIALMYAFPSSLGACGGSSSSSSSSHHGLSASPCATGVVAVADDHNIFVSLLQATPIMLFAFIINFQVLPVHNSLMKPSVKTTTTALTLSLGFCSLMYIAAGLVAYLTYGSLIHPNLLNQSSNNILMDMARIFIALVESLSYPLVGKWSGVSDDLVVRCSERERERDFVIVVVVVRGVGGGISCLLLLGRCFSSRRRGCAVLLWW